MISTRHLALVFDLSAAPVLLALLASPAPRALADDDPPPAVSVRLAETAGLRVIETVLPEESLDAAPWPGGGLAVLTRMAPVVHDVGQDSHDADPDNPGDDAPRALYRVRGQAGDLEPVATDLPGDLDSLHAAGGHLWLGGEGRLWRLDGDHPVLVLEEPGLDLGVVRRGGLFTDEGLWLPGVGRLRHYALKPGGVLEVVGEMRLPVTAERRRRALVLRGHPVTRLPGGQLIAGPEIAGQTRVRHLLVPESPDAERAEAWSRLPAPEDVEHHWYAELGGEPVFLAATTEADRLGVFEKLKLRVFRLRPDRTRAGRTPLFAGESETVNWYRFEPMILDVDHDGKDDLVLLQPDGMGSDDLVIEVYRGRFGRFERKAKRSKLDAESARWHFGTDFDGDGAADLVVATGALAIHRGTPEHRRRVVDDDPWRLLERETLRRSGEVIAEHEGGGPTSSDRPSFRSRLDVADLDGDGRPEIAIVRDSRGRAVVRLASVASP